tara:strand:- start:23505 stop:23873 length:369 start_codon:yes stop_codon:yes gene_type:complete
MLQTFNGAITQTLTRNRVRSGDRQHRDHQTADTLVGCTVFNYQNDKLGRIREVLMDPENGNIACVMLSYGGFMGLGTHVLPVPWPEFAFHITEKYPLLDIEVAAIRSAVPALGRLVAGAGFR